MSYLWLEGRAKQFGYELVKRGKSWELRHWNGEVIRRRVLDDIAVFLSLKDTKRLKYREEADKRGMGFIPSLDVECPTCGVKPGEPCRTRAKTFQPQPVVRTRRHRWREEEVPLRSRKYHTYLFSDEDSDVYPLECPDCGIETIAKKDDYICVDCRARKEL